jgi:putative addiction module killer protein
MIEVREYLGQDGRSPFAAWFEDLHSPAAAKVAVALYRLANGNFSNVKGVGSGVFEYRIDFGPGYRIYFGKEGNRLIILLGGGSKQRQNRDIQRAMDCWADYRNRKKVK